MFKYMPGDNNVKFRIVLFMRDQLGFQIWYRKN